MAALMAAAVVANLVDNNRKDFFVQLKCTERDIFLFAFFTKVTSLDSLKSHKLPVFNWEYLTILRKAIFAQDDKLLRYYD